MSPSLRIHGTNSNIYIASFNLQSMHAKSMDVRKPIKLSINEVVVQSSGVIYVDCNITLSRFLKLIRLISV